MIGPAAVRHIPEHLVLPSRPAVQHSLRPPRDRDQITWKPKHTPQAHPAEEDTLGDDPAENAVGRNVDLLA